MRSRIPIVLLTVVLISLAPTGAVTAPAWQDEFDELCSMVQVAGSLSTEEIQALIERVDALIPRIEASEDPSGKVFLFRLKKCRDFFEFTLQSR